MTALRTMNGFAAAPRPGTTPAQRRRGYTLIEMLVALSVFLVASTFATYSMLPAFKDAKVNGGYNATLMMLRQARELAIENRKTYLVTFNPPGLPVGSMGLQINQLNAGAVGALYKQPMLLPQDIQFSVVPGIPTTAATTPDSLGTGGSAIEFDIGVNGGVTNQIYFFPDGSARDINNNINNGVVYIARPGDLYSSRAITLFGAAGRVRGWRLYPPAGGIGTAKWNQQ